MLSWCALKKKITGWGKFIYAIGLDFWEKDCYTRASTLTFYTIQSLIPFLAAILAIAKGFGFDEKLKELLTSSFLEQKEVLSTAIQIAVSMLEFTSKGEVVGIGVILLLWTNINLVSYIEYVFNEIWRVKISRNYFQKLEDFLFALFLFPLILVTSSSLTLYVKSQIYHSSYFSKLSQILILPWLLSCVLFGVLYFLIPNAKIRVIPRLIASTIAGTTFQAWQLIFINLQLHIFSYNTVYGAFALIPLFLIWLQFSWIIALVGALISYHIENDDAHKYEDNEGVLERVTQNELGLLVLLDCLSEFFEGSPPIPLSQQAERLGVRPGVIAETLSIFEKNKILFSFYNKNNEICYHPLKNPDSLKVLDIYNIVEHLQDTEIIIQSPEILEDIRSTLKGLQKIAEESPKNLNLYDFFHQLKKGTQPPKQERPTDS